MARPALPEKLNVCLVARHFPVSGRATDFSFLRLIARGLAARGHSVTVLTGEDAQGRTELVQDGVKIYFLMEGRNARVRRDPFPDLVKSKFIDLHMHEPFHLIHSMDRSTMKIHRIKRDYKVAIAYDVAATRLSDVFAILATGQDTLASLIRTGLAVSLKYLSSFYSSDRKLLRSADGIFVSSPRERLALENYYLYPDVCIHTVPYGIEIGDLTPRERSEELRRSLAIPETARVVVTATDMIEVEETKNLLLAFEQVVIKRPNTRLIIVGDGPRMKEIEYEMLMLALGSKVIFAGNEKDADVSNTIALADVFVNLSSRTTGFEPSLLEAMAQKKIIIGSEVSPMSTIVEHAQDGFLIRPADVTELTTLLLDVFAGHIDAERIGEAARQKVLDLFDPEKMVAETLQSYYAILKNTGHYRVSDSLWDWIKIRLFTYG